MILLTEQCGHAGQDGQQGGGAEPGGRQRGLLGQTHGLPLPVPLARRGLLALLLFAGPRSSSQAGADGHGHRPGAGETRRPVSQHQRHAKGQAGGGGARQRLQLGEQDQAGSGS